MDSVSGPWYRSWQRGAPDGNRGAAAQGAEWPAQAHRESPPASSVPPLHVQPSRHETLRVQRHDVETDAANGVRCAHVVGVANQKGGVGKTTTAVSLAAALAALGRRVLLVDMDPQGNATSAIGIDRSALKTTIYDVLVAGQPVEAAFVDTALARLTVVPATIDLAGAEIELVSAFNREQQLRRVLEPVRDRFEVIMVDCPPSLGLLTINVLSAADGLVVPVQAEYFALEGLGALDRNAQLIRSQLNPQLRITGFLLTMLDARTRLTEQVVSEVERHYGDLVFRTRIPRSIRLAEAPGFGQPISLFDPTSRGALAYERLARELLERLASVDADADEGVPA